MRRKEKHIGNRWNLCRNAGSATVEACLVVPLFLFFMLAVSEIAMLFLAEAHIHQSLAEAAKYTAGYAYLEEKALDGKSAGVLEGMINKAVLDSRFQSLLGEDFYVERMVEHGKKGIRIMIEEDTENPKIFTARASCGIKAAVPVFGDIHFTLSNRIKQKAFVGYSSEEKSDCYVYITPNQSVYHMKRSCTHLVLSIEKRDRQDKGGFVPCGFCGRGRYEGEVIYVARTGNVYHYRADCSGLKRTVTRIKKEQAGGLSACSRCGGK